VNEDKVARQSRLVGQLIFIYKSILIQEATDA